MSTTVRPARKASRLAALLHPRRHQPPAKAAATPAQPVPLAVRRRDLPVFDQAQFATGVTPSRPAPYDVDALIAELDLLAGPIACGTLRVTSPEADR